MSPVIPVIGVSGEIAPFVPDAFDLAGAVVSGLGIIGGKKGWVVDKEISKTHKSQQRLGNGLPTYILSNQMVQTPIDFHQ